MKTNMKRNMKTNRISILNDKTLTNGIEDMQKIHLLIGDKEILFDFNPESNKYESPFMEYLESASLEEEVTLSLYDLYCLMSNEQGKWY